MKTLSRKSKTSIYIFTVPNQRFQSEIRAKMRLNRELLLLLHSFIKRKITGKIGIRKYIWISIMVHNRPCVVLMRQKSKQPFNQPMSHCNVVSCMRGTNFVMFFCMLYRYNSGIRKYEFILDTLVVSSKCTKKLWTVKWCIS